MNLLKYPIVSYAGWLLVFSAFVFYGYGIFEAIRLSWPPVLADQTMHYPVVLASAVGSIQALLLTNLGMLLGISVANPQSAVARSLRLERRVQVDMAPPPPPDMRESLQLFALVIYLVGLIACMITWIAAGFSSDSKVVVSVIPESGRMFIGVVLAYLTAVLGKVK